MKKTLSIFSDLLPGLDWDPFLPELDDHVPAILGTTFQYKDCKGEADSTHADSTHAVTNISDSIHADSNHAVTNISDSTHAVSNISSESFETCDRRSIGERSTNEEPEKKCTELRIEIDLTDVVKWQKGNKLIPNVIYDINRTGSENDQTIGKVHIFSPLKENITARMRVELDKIAFCDAWLKSQELYEASKGDQSQMRYSFAKQFLGETFILTKPRRTHSDDSFDAFLSCFQSDDDWEFKSCVDSDIQGAVVSRSAEQLAVKTDAHNASYQYLISSVSDPVLVHSSLDLCYSDEEIAPTNDKSVHEDLSWHIVHHSVSRGLEKYRELVNDSMHSLQDDNYFRSKVKEDVSHSNDPVLVHPSVDLFYSYEEIAPTNDKGVHEDLSWHIVHHSVSRGLEKYQELVNDSMHFLQNINYVRSLVKEDVSHSNDPVLVHPSIDLFYSYEEIAPTNDKSVHEDLSWHIVHHSVSRGLEKYRELVNDSMLSLQDDNYFWSMVNEDVTHICKEKPKESGEYISQGNYQENEMISLRTQTESADKQVFQTTVNHTPADESDIGHPVGDCFLFESPASPMVDLYETEEPQQTDHPVSRELPPMIYTSVRSLPDELTKERIYATGTQESPASKSDTTQTQKDQDYLRNKDTIPETFAQCRDAVRSYREEPLCLRRTEVEKKDINSDVSTKQVKTVLLQQEDLHGQHLQNIHLYEGCGSIASEDDLEGPSKGLRKGKIPTFKKTRLPTRRHKISALEKKAATSSGVTGTVQLEMRNVKGIVAGFEEKLFKNNIHGVEEEVIPVANDRLKDGQLIEDFIQEQIKTYCPKPEQMGSDLFRTEQLEGDPLKEGKLETVSFKSEQLTTNVEQLDRLYAECQRDVGINAKHQSDEGLTTKSLGYGQMKAEKVRSVSVKNDHFNEEFAKYLRLNAEYEMDEQLDLPGLEEKQLSVEVGQFNEECVKHVQFDSECGQDEQHVACDVKFEQLNAEYELDEQLDLSCLEEEQLSVKVGQFNEKCVKHVHFDSECGQDEQLIAPNIKLEQLNTEYEMDEQLNPPCLEEKQLSVKVGQFNKECVKHVRFDSECGQDEQLIAPNIKLEQFKTEYTDSFEMETQSPEEPTHLRPALSEEDMDLASVFNKFKLPVSPRLHHVGDPDNISSELITTEATGPFVHFADEYCQNIPEPYAFSHTEHGSPAVEYDQVTAKQNDFYNEYYEITSETELDETPGTGMYVQQEPFTGSGQETLHSSEPPQISYQERWLSQEPPQNSDEEILLRQQLRPSSDREPGLEPVQSQEPPELFDPRTYVERESPQIPNQETMLEQGPQQIHQETWIREELPQVPEQQTSFREEPPQYSEQEAWLRQEVPLRTEQETWVTQEPSQLYEQDTCFGQELPQYSEQPTWFSQERSQSSEQQTWLEQEPPQYSEQETWVRQEPPQHSKEEIWLRPETPHQETWVGQEPLQTFEQEKWLRHELPQNSEQETWVRQEPSDTLLSEYTSHSPIIADPQQPYPTPKNMSFLTVTQGSPRRHPSQNPGKQDPKSGPSEGIFENVYNHCSISSPSTPMAEDHGQTHISDYIHGQAALLDNQETNSEYPYQGLSSPTARNDLSYRRGHNVEEEIVGRGKINVQYEDTTGSMENNTSPVKKTGFVAKMADLFEKR